MIFFKSLLTGLFLGLQSTISAFILKGLQLESNLIESSYILGKMLKLTNNLAFHLAFQAIKREDLHLLDNQQHKTTTGQWKFALKKITSVYVTPLF